MQSLAIASLFSGLALAAPSNLVRPRTSVLDETFTGDGTFYNTYGGDGACGTALSDDVPSVALSFLLYDSFPGATANPNDNPICQESITVSFGGVTQTFPVKDRCAGCEEDGDVDMTPAAFSAMQLSVSEGRIPGITWTFTGAGGSSGSGSGSGGSDPSSSPSSSDPAPTSSATPTSTPQPQPTPSSSKAHPHPRPSPSSSSSSALSVPSSAPGTGSTTPSEGGGSGSDSGSGSGDSDPSPSSSSPSSSATSGSGSSSSSSGGSTTSTSGQEGAFVKCTSSTTWSLCSSVTGECTAMGSVAAGMTCDESDSKGTMEALATGSKRMRRHLRKAQH